MKINFINFQSGIIFICLLQSAIFSILLLKRGRQKRFSADWWLAALLFFICSSLITPFIGFAGVYDANQWLTYFPFYIPYTYGICVYFYVINLTGAKRQFKIRDLILFVPAVSFVTFRLILFAQDNEFKDWFNENYYIPLVNPLTFITEFVWNLFFLRLAVKRYREYRCWLNDHFSDLEKIKFDWLRNFHYLSTAVFVIGGIFDFTDSFIVNLSYFQYFYFELLLAVLVYYLAIAGYLRIDRAILEYQSVPVVVESIAEVSLKKVLPEQGEFEKLKLNLQNLMECEKPHLEPQLTLGELAKMIGINTSILSYVINQGFGKNFNDFVNEYRIAEVKKKLLEDETRNSTLMGIAFDCGFNSKSTFNRAFKKLTGLSPKDFHQEKN